MGETVILDHEGNEWVVRRVVDTSHDFAVYLGKPLGRHTGRGAPRVILTPELARHLERHRRDNIEAHRLPVGANVVKNLRKELGYNRYDDAAAWWLERAADLASLTLEDFAAKHSRKVGAIERARLQLFGKRLRDAGWWRDEPARSLILSDRPAREIAEALGIAPGSVGRLRDAFKQEGQFVAADYRERIGRSTRGKPAHPNTARALRKAARRRKSRRHRKAIGEALRRYHAAHPDPPPRRPDHRPWTAREERSLGQTLDRVVAGVLGRSIAAVRSRRIQLGIPQSRHAGLRNKAKNRKGDLS